MAANEVQDELIKALLTLCKSEGSLWRALQGREGVQLLISLLSPSSEQQQEYAIALLCLYLMKMMKVNGQLPLLVPPATVLHEHHHDSSSFNINVPSPPP
ncbi:unnamed protein product [Vicia faba]|uniref:Uncharacterized protein n=1 Tax=Vicia faba TaxID=3906 RepID=A0AAV1AEC1_VICFA|nr:unnamed protein product [Vicia faba]